MRLTHLKILVLFLATIMCYVLCWGQSSDSVQRTSNLKDIRDSRFIPVKNRAIDIYDVATPRNEIGKKLFRIREHPAFDSLMTSEIAQELLTEINNRCDYLHKDTLLTADLLWVYRPYLDWLFREDPHYRVEARIPAKNINDIKQLKVPAFDLLCINDTVVVNHSLDPNFRTGDRIISINGVDMPGYMEYTYRNRYDTPANIMRCYYFSNAVANFKMMIERGGNVLTITTSGETQRDVSVKLTQQRELTTTLYPEAKCGYISIPRFYFDNSRLTKVVHKTIKKFKASGLTNVILDVRMNPGGNGHNFDELLSIFTDRPVVKYLRGAKVKASPRAMEVFDFLTEEMTGNIVDLPQNEIVREFTTNRTMYIEGVKYYVLMSKNTGSIAASFCNILQYNDAATLVGEPLLRNAMKYGEILPGRMLLPTLLQPSAISIVAYDEYTKAVDGVLMPDILIPYVASDYLSGEDAMLEKLLEIIKSKKLF